MNNDSIRRNPWIAGHVGMEVAFQTGDLHPRDRKRAAEMAASVVEAEYALCPDPIECPHCGQETHWKATVGAMICPACGGMARSNGKPIGTRKW